MADKPAKPRRRMPTPRYMAARLIADMLGEVLAVTPTRVEEFFAVRLTEKRSADFYRTLVQMADRLNSRVRKIIEDFENPKPRELRGACKQKSADAGARIGGADRSRAG